MKFKLGISASQQGMRPAFQRFIESAHIFERVSTPALVRMECRTSEEWEGSRAGVRVEIVPGGSCRLPPGAHKIRPFGRGIGQRFLLRQSGTRYGAVPGRALADSVTRSQPLSFSAFELAQLSGLAALLRAQLRPIAGPTAYRGFAGQPLPTARRYPISLSLCACSCVVRIRFALSPHRSRSQPCGP